MAPSFRISFWGYRRGEVDEYFARAVSEFEAQLKARDLEVARTEVLNEHVKLDIQRTEEEITRHRKRELAIAEAIVRAQVEAAAIEEDAKRTAETMSNSVMAEVAGRRAELAALRAQIGRFRVDLMQLLQRYKVASSPDGTQSGQGQEALPRLGPGGAR